MGITDLVSIALLRYSQCSYESGYLLHYKSCYCVLLSFVYAETIKILLLLLHCDKDFCYTIRAVTEEECLKHF